MSAEIMCNFCKGAGGWGSGKDAEVCPDCKGTGTVSFPGRANHGTDCEVCDGTGSAYGKRCDHAEVQS